MRKTLRVVLGLGLAVALAIVLAPSTSACSPQSVGSCSCGVGSFSYCQLYTTVSGCGNYNCHNYCGHYTYKVWMTWTWKCVQQYTTVTLPNGTKIQVPTAVLPQNVTNTMSQCKAQMSCG